MNTKLLYLLTMLFLLAGCTPNDDPEPDKTYLLQRKFSNISFPNGGGVTIDWEYSYNENDQLIRIDATSDRDGVVKEGSTYIQYDEHGQLNEITNDFGWKWDLYYSQDNRLAKMERTYKDLRPITHHYTYNSSGYLTGVKTNSEFVAGEPNNNSTVIAYDKSNQITIKRFSGSGEEYDVVTISTDGHKRPIPHLPSNISITFHTADFDGESLITTQNLLRSKVTKIKPTNTVDGSYSSVYTYNEAGYPLTWIKSFDAGSIENITYTYSVK